MRIGELSRRTGCKVETIRYYERIGLMPEPPRRGRYRDYRVDDAERLRFIRASRDFGFSLNETRELIRCAHSPEQGCSDVRSLAGRHLAELRSRIADLQSMEQSLAKAIQTCGSADGCPVIDQVSAGRCVSADDIRLW